MAFQVVGVVLAVGVLAVAGNNILAPCEKKGLVFQANFQYFHG